ncbi:MAG: hypothetical protein V2A34_11695 [Lentisphaerota bacterium]
MNKTLAIAAWIACLACLPAYAAGPATNTAAMPFWIYHEYMGRENHGTPSGWMGDYRDIQLDMKCTNRPYSGTTCMRFAYSALGSRYSNMAGVMWQNPANNGGDIDGGADLTGARQLVFWARGETGRELLDAFSFGGTIGAYPDSDKVTLSNVRLSTEWTRYAIDLSNADLSYISCFFSWIASRFNNRDGFVFYLDDIYLTDEEEEAISP